MTSGSGENQIEYDIEEEVETKTEENQVEHEHDAKTDEEQDEKNNDHEVKDLHVEKTNMKHNYKCRSTSGMASHIKSKHELIKEKEKKQLTIRETINNSEAIIYNKDSFKKFLIRWIVKDDLPFTCVESEDFCNIIYFLCKDAFISSADTVKNYIMTFYEDNHKKIALILQNTSSKISFTIDAWTSSNNYSFLGITAHWVTESWELKSILLDFIKLEGPHSEANIKEAFLKTAQQALTTLKAVENDETSDEEVGSLIRKLRTLVKKIKASPQQENKFKAQYKAANVPNLNVMLDVCTRWNSIYDILSLNTLSNSDPTLRPFTINEEEWVHLLKIEELLKCFAKATKQICEETYPTISYVIPIYNILLNKLEDFCDTLNRFENGKEAATNAINKLKTYYNKTDSTLYAVSLKYNSSDEDFVSYISKWRRIESVSEFDRYLKADRAQALCDILNWWKRHEEEYPNLSNMARDYLGIPATSAPSERIFLSAADVITYDRASFASETVRAVMCLKHWFRSGVLD
ncbi:zinc finger BED domain-containing protein RICESLEEPER 2-like [Rhizophagus clarus]|uniref:Zinc finger BED domain-containing protein RICESLEEPER 2-like n=1 Tax=Rhizophagus clarus TaxID=94130 RepID=A0A8H3LVJ4_9GLOM|nr:zinc finger BED domain-containing protein RICESLEEPER 2-like [Rhizophagus clarus]